MSSPGGPVGATEVDGVRVVASSRPGPLRGGLLLRVGTADETVPTAGVTRLAVRRAARDLAADVEVGQVVTRVRMSGDDVPARLSALADRLATLPLDGLDDVRAALAAERAGRPADVRDALLRRRFGLVAHGVATAPGEYGAERLAAAEVAGWVARRAVRAGVVAWLTGPPPPGLRLALPEGARRSAPQPAPRLGSGPTWFRGPRGVVGVLGVVPAGAVGAALADRLRAAVRADLARQGVGGAVPATTLEQITADEALLTVTVPVPDGAQKVVTAALLGAVERAAGEGAGDAVAGDAAEPGAGPDGGPDVDADPDAGLVRAAEALLLAGPDPDAVARIAGTAPPAAGVAAAQVGTAALSYLLGALAAVPFGSGEIPAPWLPEPSSRQEPFSQRWFRPVEAPDDPRQLSLDAGGVSLWTPPGTHVTVPVAATAAVLRWPDGRRLLLGEDGAEVDVEPTMWVGGAAVVEAVDATWPASLVVDRPARPASDVPQPDRAPGEDPRLLPVTATQGFRRMALVAAVCCLGCVGVTVVFGAGQELFGALMVSICAVTMSSSTFRSINVRQGMGLRRPNPGPPGRR